MHSDALSLAKQALSPVADELEILLQKIPHLLPCETKTAQKMVQTLFSHPGKMIRPALFFLSCRLVNYEGDHFYPMGAVSEFVHTASLLHDDVVDSSTLRRNRPTTNSIWGDEAAVLLGDLIYARASELMAETNEMEIVSSFARSIRLMSESELLQLDSVFNLDLQEGNYLRILHGKTAALIGSACKSAGILAQRSRNEISSLETFGFNLGISFQLVDDALDFLGDGKLLGKKHFIDLQEGRVTLPILYLQSFISDEERKSLRQLYYEGNLLQSDIEYVASLVQKYETAEMTIERAQKLTDISLKALRDNFPASESRHHIEKLAEFLSLRTF